MSHPYKEKAADNPRIHFKVHPEEAILRMRRTSSVTMRNPILKARPQFALFMIIAAICLPICAVADGPILSREDATKVLGFMAYKNIQIAFIVQNYVPPTGSPNGAQVVAIVQAPNGGYNRIEQQFFFDNTIGWFCTEEDQERTGVRLWTTNGYQEISPPIVQQAPATTSAGGTPPPSQDEALEGRLNNVYGKLKAKLDDAGRVKLKVEQLQWLKQRAAITDPEQSKSMTRARIGELEVRLNQ